MATAASRAAISLLVIDDNPGSVELLSNAVAQPGLEILTASNPEEGLDLFRRRRPQIVLTDLMMPRMNGMEVLERIMEVDPATDVILMSAHYSTESAVEAVKKGASDYLNKPVSIGPLRERIGKAGGRSQEAATRTAARGRVASELRVRRNRRPQPADVGNVLAHPARGPALSGVADHGGDAGRVKTWSPVRSTDSAQWLPAATSCSTARPSWKRCSRASCLAT